MKKVLTVLLVICLSGFAFAQKDTVNVLGYYESGFVYGTLNDAIDAAIADGSISNTVFKLTPYEQYVLSKSIYLDHGQDLEIVAPAPGTDQESAPPQILWTEEDIERGYMIQSYGDVTMKNIWIRYSDTQGGKLGTGIVFENQNEGNDPEVGIFDGCLFDYFQIGPEAAGAVTVKADHYDGTFTSCYFRNGNDNHFQYYGRAISFPFESTGWHYDNLLFENCTFSNLSRIIMQEGNEYGTNVHLNHCTLLNSIEWPYQGRGWWEKLSITNSIFVNAYLMGYEALDVCDDDQDYDDFEDGLCDPPGGGLMSGFTEVDSLGFEVPFTDHDRKLLISNNVYMHQDWMADWYHNCPSAQELIRTRHSEELRQISPMVGQDAIDFIDSLDTEGNKVFPKMNIEWSSIYEQGEDPDFIKPATNEDTLKIFIEYKWTTNADVDWSYQPAAGFNQVWPLPEDMAYTNATYLTAAMGGFPLGDMNWFPDQKAAWEAQKSDEWTVINNWLDTGSPDGTSVKRLNSIKPMDYTLDQNYPNPFNPVTNIAYSVPSDGYVTLRIFNSNGQEVQTLLSEHQSAGRYEVTFDGSNLSGGIYLYTLEAANTTITKKFVLMK